MTTGERMVWAEVFARRLEASTSGDPAPAARAACRAVQMLRALGVEGAWRRALNEDQCAMLDDMLGTGSDRVPVRSIGGEIVGELQVPR